MLMLEPNIRIILLLTALLLTAILANHTILYIFLMNENLLRMTNLHCKASGTSSEKPYLYIAISAYPHSISH
ncbi:hypothetical protein BDV39DRAFT_170286 [Aspergillus sergii]|uniref:Uncharacterized protein n=1 Tax=Aspergillus sergii TaxID=1034303 RepID=A0A5N6XB88_9EURO|nr:hypothetical protein BDV39DRAFT_170286 [Aspergillus sergii]